MKYSLMHFINILITILKKYVKYGKLYYAMIVFNSFIWRNDIYDKDKATRVQKTDFNNKIFSIFEEYAEQLGIQKISSQRLEGDDVIYLSHKMLFTYLTNILKIIYPIITISLLGDLAERKSIAIRQW